MVDEDGAGKPWEGLVISGESLAGKGRGTSAGSQEELFWK